MSLIENLPLDLQTHIYEFKHKLELMDVMNELHTQSYEIYENCVAIVYYIIQNDYNNCLYESALIYKALFNDGRISRKKFMYELRQIDLDSNVLTLMDLLYILKDDTISINNIMNKYKYILPNAKRLYEDMRYWRECNYY